MNFELLAKMFNVSIITCAVLWMGIMKNVFREFWSIYHEWGSMSHGLLPMDYDECNMNYDVRS